MENIRILYEDNHLLGVEKPVNMPVQEDITKDTDLLSCLKKYIKEKYNKPGDVFLGLVHRLDRPVGGAMIFAKTSKAASRLSEQVRTRQIQKTYIAVTEGSFQTKEGVWHNYLLKNQETNIVRVVPDGTPESRKAVLYYQVLCELEGKTLVKINLETGRPHQIRVQFSHYGHPVFGDVKYGKPGQGGLTTNLALWSYELAFKHPVKDEKIRLFSTPPKQYPWYLFSEALNTIQG